MAGKTWRCSFLCECGAWVEVWYDPRADTNTYIHGGGEAVATFSRADLVFWALGHPEAIPHPARDWFTTIHRYEAA